MMLSIPITPIGLLIDIEHGRSIIGTTLAEFQRELPSLGGWHQLNSGDDLCHRVTIGNFEFLFWRDDASSEHVLQLISLDLGFVQEENGDLAELGKVTYDMSVEEFLSTIPETLHRERDASATYAEVWKIGTHCRAFFENDPDELESADKSTGLRTIEWSIVRTT